MIHSDRLIHVLEVEMYWRKLNFNNKSKRRQEEPSEKSENESLDMMFHLVQLRTNARLCIYSTL